MTMTAEGRNQAQHPVLPHSGAQRAKLRFERLPAAYCHPERIAGLLPEGLAAGLRDRLAASSRLRLRLSALLERRFALPSLAAVDLATPEARFALLEGETLQGGLRRAGAIWHARSLRRIILAETLRRLVQRLGRANHRAALRFVDLAPEDNERDGIDLESPDIDGLMALIERDGLIAVNAWCRHQPAALAARLRLKLPPCPEADDEPPASHRDRGLMIVDRVVTTLAAESDQQETTGVPGHG